MIEHYDAQFRIRAAVPDFDAHLERYRALSEATRHELRTELYAYGSSPLEHADVFLPRSDGDGRAMHVFLHGGYWRAFDKSDYSFIARPIVAAGAIAVVANYRLMPVVSMAELITDCRTLIQRMYANASRFGASSRRISISGHSAGGHLATLLALTRWEKYGLPDDVVKSALIVSGLFDLQPVLKSFLAVETGLTPEDARRFSPLAWVQQDAKPCCEVTLAVGGQETSEFLRQSAVFAEALRTKGVTVDFLTLAGRHHMNIVLDMGESESALANRMLGGRDLEGVPCTTSS